MEEEQQNNEEASSSKRSRKNENQDDTVESEISTSSVEKKKNGENEKEGSTGSGDSAGPSSSKTEINDNSMTGSKAEGTSTSSNTKPLFNPANKSKISKRNYRPRRNPVFSSSSSSETSSSSSSDTSSSSNSSSTDGEEDEEEATGNGTGIGLKKRSRRRRIPKELVPGNVPLEKIRLDSNLEMNVADLNDSFSSYDGVRNVDDSVLNNNIEEDDDEDELDSESSESNRTTPDMDSLQMNTDFLSNPKPNYHFRVVPDILHRQSGLAGYGGRNTGWRDPNWFQNKVSGCRHTVEKLELMYKLKGHDGCVNALNFNRSGRLLVSGSDDLKIMLWRWASNEMVYQFDSKHDSNVFQTKFMETGTNGIHIISSARDGQVQHHELPSSGASPVSSVIIKHSGPVHKIALPEMTPYEVLTAGEDGHVIRCDLRENLNERIVTVKAKQRHVALYSISAHPFKSEFCVSGRDQFVRVYDKRNIKKAPLRSFCPTHLLEKNSSGRHFTYITCAVYNYLGDEILASYSEDDIYLFDVNNSTPGSFLQKFQGHQNSCTIKGVNFFGAKSEFIMSGSDCGNCFFWDKQNQSIVQWMPGDEGGVVNVLEPHPSFPFLATSGIDNDVKIWVPSSEEKPTLAGLKRCVQKNIEGRVAATGDLLEHEIISFFMRQCMRRRGQNSSRGSRSHSPNVTDLISSSDNSDEDFDNSTNEKLQSAALPCTPS